MKAFGIVLVICVAGAACLCGGCASRPAVRCDGKLEPINTPAIAVTDSSGPLKPGKAP